MENSVEHEIKELFEVHENNFCFECGGRSNQWASVNNGIFLCLACSGIHKGFGTDISLVRSLGLDAWSPLQLEMMRKGGNDKLKEFFERYNISMEGPLDAKYKTKAAFYYRDRLRALAEGGPVPEPPSIEEGSEIVNNETSSGKIGYLITGKAVGPISTETPEKKKSLNNSFVKAKTLVVTGAPKLGKEVALGLKSIGNTMAVGAKSVATGAKNVATKLNEKMKESHFKQDVKVFGNKVAVGAKQTAGKIAVASKDIIVQGGQFVGKGAKKGYIGAVGLIKTLGTKKKGKKQAEAPVNDENVNSMNYHEIAPSENKNEPPLVEDQAPTISL